MPPDEPVEESIEELLSAVSFEASLSSGDRSGSLVMRKKDGDWWRFTFREGLHGWEIVGCSTPSDEAHHPRDMLGPVYGPYFGPFLRHVAESANAPEAPNQPSQPTPPRRRG